MFGNRVDDATKDTIVTVISADAVIEGSLIAKHAIRVDGVVNGAVRTKESVVVGNNAIVRGGIRASNVMSAGDVYGGIESPKGKVEISDTGRVFGDITAARLIIDENAVFQGNCTMTGRGSKASAETVKVPDDLETTAEKEAKEARKHRDEDGDRIPDSNEDKPAKAADSSAEEDRKETSADGDDNSSRKDGKEKESEDDAEK
ncbi:MAG: polymer-forming cytoskeletal protein [Lachnospiraceae bacterium]|nr:polymer-forming cytoskeletal protein [Lachnospiraceae bacterium]